MKTHKSAIKLVQDGAKFIRFTGGDENNYFMGSYWELNGEIVRCEDRFNHEVASKISQACTEVGKVSAGYHTFDELYKHRCTLFQALCNLMPDNCFKTLKNFEGEEWPGWFILVCDHPVVGQMSYHLPTTQWDECRVSVRERNNNFDFHTSEDVVERLSKI